MSNTRNNKQIDPDILQCKADILRSRAIIPSTPPPLVKKEAGQSEVPRFDLAEEIMAEQRKITAIRRKAPGVSRPLRRIAASKAGASSRKAVAQKTNSALSMRAQSRQQAVTVSHTIEQPEQEQIIAEIVARDIEELCRGDYSAGSK